jgi:hypothetical protein
MASTTEFVSRHRGPTTRPSEPSAWVRRRLRAVATLGDLIARTADGDGSIPKIARCEGPIRSSNTAARSIESYSCVRRTPSRRSDRYPRRAVSVEAKAPDLSLIWLIASVSTYVLSGVS